MQDLQLNNAVAHNSYVRSFDATHTAAAVSAIALFVTGDRSIAQHLTDSLAKSGDDSLTILFVESIADAMTQLRQNDSIDAVLLDWDVITTGCIDTFRVLLESVPDLPVIVTGEEQNLMQRMNLVERGAEDYLLKSSLNSHVLVTMVHIAIARKYRAWILAREARPASVMIRSTDDADDDVGSSAPFDQGGGSRVRNAGGRGSLRVMWRKLSAKQTRVE